MFNFIVSNSLKYRVIVLSIATFLVAYGHYTLPRVPIDVFPDLTRPSVTIMTESDGLPTAEVERFVTAPVENALRGIPELARIRSTSAAGLSIVLAEFEWTTNLTTARAAVSERLGRLQGRLPPGIAPQMGGVGTIMGETHLIAVTAPALDGIALRDIVDRTIRPQLMDVPGVAQVNPIGGGVRQIRISPDMKSMAVAGVSLENIASTLAGLG